MTDTENLLTSIIINSDSDTENTTENEDQAESECFDDTAYDKDNKNSSGTNEESSSEYEEAQSNDKSNWRKRKKKDRKSGKRKEVLLDAEKTVRVIHQQFFQCLVLSTTWWTNFLMMKMK
jgi:hypothetical protein